MSSGNTPAAFNASVIPLGMPNCRAASDGWVRGQYDYIMCTALRKQSTAASNCVECGKCERHCPQHIAIREELKKARKTLEGPVYKVARSGIRLVMKY